MNYSLLVPICLISTLMGIMLPRIFEASPSKLILAAIGYLLIMLAVDVIFGSKKVNGE